MKYYNPINKKDVLAMRRYLKGEGHETTVQIYKITINREVNKYNKYMKWHVEADTFSEWFKSKPAAIRYLSQPCRPLPVGNRFAIHYNLIIGGV